MSNADSSNKYSYNPVLKDRASSLRKNMTKAEACLWKYALRAQTMKGYTFNRQRPVLNYIADFICKKLLLIIEVDGISHFNEIAYTKDNIRQRKLEQNGFKVIRFLDNEVLKDMQNVIRCLEITIEEREVELKIVLPLKRIKRKDNPLYATPPALSVRGIISEKGIIVKA